MNKDAVELVDGGLQWSGSSVTLRMVESNFHNYQKDLQDYLDSIEDEGGIMSKDAIGISHARLLLTEDFA